MKFRASAICDLMGVSRRQLDRWIKAGTFPLPDGRDAKGYWWEGEEIMRLISCTTRKCSLRLCRVLNQTRQSWAGWARLALWRAGVSC